MFSYSVGHKNNMVKFSQFFDLFCYFLELNYFYEVNQKSLTGAGDTTPAPRN